MKVKQRYDESSHEPHEVCVFRAEEIKSRIDDRIDAYGRVWRIVDEHPATATVTAQHIPNLVRFGPEDRLTPEQFAALLHPLPLGPVVPRPR